MVSVVMMSELPYYNSFCSNPVKLFAICIQFQVPYDILSHHIQIQNNPNKHFDSLEL
ncbi:hypothetical protein HanIR_Chr06g0285201 [Helianthus annuus]|nr:hypothetical protein HanIR_Chr06g0285201 [Helianthus annuus]